MRALLATLLLSAPSGCLSVGLITKLQEPGPDPARTESRRREQGILQPGNEDYGPMNTEWDITQNPELMHDIRIAIEQGVAEYFETPPCANAGTASVATGPPSFALGHVNRVGRRWLTGNRGNGQVVTEYEISAMQPTTGGTTETIFRVVLNHSPSTRPMTKKARMALRSTRSKAATTLQADPTPAPDTAADRPLVAYINPLTVLPACVRVQIEAYSNQRAHQTLPLAGTEEYNNWAQDNMPPDAPAFGEPQPLPDIAAGSGYGASRLAAYSVYTPPKGTIRAVNQTIAPGMQDHYDGKMVYATGLLPSAGDVLVHTINLAAIPDECVAPAMPPVLVTLFSPTPPPHHLTLLGCCL